jgi:hypothetical protein
MGFSDVGDICGDCKGTGKKPLLTRIQLFLAYMNNPENWLDLGNGGDDYWLDKTASIQEFYTAFGIELNHIHEWKEQNMSGNFPYYSCKGCGEEIHWPDKPKELKKLDNLQTL